MGKDLEREVRTWLDGKGYPLEMRVAKLFRNHGYQVEQSEFYIDGDGRTLRETDVIASLQTSTAKQQVVRVTFVVECKSSTDKPWLLLSAGTRLGTLERVTQRAASASALDILRKVAEEEAVHRHPLFTLGDRSAYSLVQAFSDNNDPAYNAACAVASAAGAQATAANARSAMGRSTCEIAFPVLVVNSPVFEVYLDERGDLAMNRVTDACLVWRNPIVGMPHTIIQVVHSDGLADYLDRISKPAGSLVRLLVRELEERYP